MFLRYFKLCKTSFTSNATRESFHFKRFFLLQNKHKKLSLKKKWLSGRNSQGRIIFWTKKALKHEVRSINLNKNFRYFKLNFIASFHFISFKNKLTSLLFLSNGCVSYFLTTEIHVLFNYSFFSRKKVLFFLFENYFNFLFRIPKLSFVSSVELNPGKNSKYALSSGSFIKLLTFDYNNHVILSILPSKFKKLASFYSLAALSKNALSANRKFSNNKAGYWRNFGNKSLVRGVAMNPVDHPHGGRAKSVKYQRTPWGKNTKRK